MEDQFQSEVQNFKFLTSSLIELIKDQVEESEIIQSKKHHIKVKEAEKKIKQYESLVKDLKQVQDQLKSKSKQTEESYQVIE